MKIRKIDFMELLFLLLVLTGEHFFYLVNLPITEMDLAVIIAVVMFFVYLLYYKGVGLSGFVYNIARTRTRKAIQIKKILAEYIEWSGIYLVFDYIVRYGIEGTRTKHELWNEVVYTISFYGVSVLWFLSALTIGLAFVLFIGQKSEKFYLLCGGRLFHRSNLFKVGVAL